MKRILTLGLLLLSIFVITGCNGTEKVEVPDFYGMDYGDAVRLANDLDITLSPSSDYSDDVFPNSVFSQNVEHGTKVAVKSEIEVVYSRGYSPDGVIVVPDLSTYTKGEVRAWLAENDIKKYNFYDSFSPDIIEAGFIDFEVEKTETRDDNLRKDTYKFYFSVGPVEVQEVEFDNPSAVRGVNLGGWFVLEGWMTPDLFAGIDGSDETAFLQQKEDAEAAIINHWETFITEDDFKWLSDHDVDYIRLPIPWWMWGVENAYEGTEHEVDYVASVAYIDRAMTWAEDYDINVLIDLHAAPGCQNGFDNGGIAGTLDWPKKENVELTLDIVEDMAIHFSQFDSFWGFELLNEPGWGVNMAILQDYYVNAYILVRQHAPDVWVGFHDGFRGYDESSWNRFFSDNSYFYNVFLDVHLYHVFGDWTKTVTIDGKIETVPWDISDHVRWVKLEDKKHIDRYRDVVPVVIGEWSAALPGGAYEGLDEASIREVKLAFANSQFNAYETGMGWFFWNYRIDADSHKEWDFKRMVELGYFPESFKTEE